MIGVDVGGDNTVVGGRELVVLVLILALGEIRQGHGNEVAVIIVFICHEPAIGSECLDDAPEEVILEKKRVAIGAVDAGQLPIIVGERIGAVGKKVIVAGVVLPAREIGTVAIQMVGAAGKPEGANLLVGPLAAVSPGDDVGVAVGGIEVY